MDNTELKNLFEQLQKHQIISQQNLNKKPTFLKIDESMSDVVYSAYNEGFNRGQCHVLDMVIASIKSLGVFCSSCDSLQISLDLANQERSHLSSQNFSLETENIAYRYTIQMLKNALESLYNDVKSEHGLDESSIEEDSSSLGMAKSALIKMNKIKI